MAISVGSVEVDVVPNTQGIYARLRGPLVAAAARAGDEAGEAAGNRMAASMAASARSGTAAAIGQHLGRQIARQIVLQVQGSVRDGVTAGGRTARSTAARQGDDTAGAFARAARARLEAAYRSMPRLDVTLTTTGADADLARLRARLESLSNRRIGVDVDADTALREITDLEARLRRVGESHPNVQVRTDTAAARAQLAALRAQINGIDGDDVDIDVRPAVRSFSTLTTSVAAFGPAALPVLAGATAAVGALAASFAAAGAAGGLLGVVVGQQIKGLREQRAAVDAARDAVTAAEQQMAAADTKAQRAAAAQKLAAAQRELARAQRDMSPAARTASKAMDGLQAAWQRFLKDTQGPSLGLATRGMNLLAAAVPKLRPLFDVAATAAEGLLSRLARFVSGGGLDRLVGWLSSTAGPAMRDFTAIIANVGVGIGGMIRQFGGAAGRMSGSLVGVTARFREWGQSGEGVRSLLGYVQRTGPGVSQMLGNLGGALLNLLAALLPLAGTATAFLNTIAAGIRAIPTQVLSVLGVTFASVAIGAKLAALAMGLWRAAQVAATVATAVLTGQTHALNAAMRANLIGLIITAIGALVVAIIYAYNNFGWFRTGVQAAWRGIQVAVSFAWNSVLKPTFNAIWTALQFVGRIAMWLWQKAIGPAFRGIATVAKWLLTIVAVIVIGPLIIAFKLLAKIGRWLWKNAIAPAFRGIAAVATWLWQKIIRPYIRAWMAIFRALATVGRWLWRKILAPAFRGIGAVAKWLWEKAIRPVFNWIADKAKWLWRKAIKPAFDAIKKAVRLVVTAFRNAKDSIKRAWDKLQGIAKKPVNFIIGTVYNDGIRRVWNTVVGAFGGKKLGKVQKLATGGVLPGYTPGRDVHLAALSGGEAVMRPEWTRAVGSGYVAQMNTAARHGGVGGVQRALGIPGFALGGIFDGIGDVASGAWDKLKKGAAWLKDTFGGAVRAGVKTVVNPLIDLVPGGGRFTGVLKAAARKAVQRLLGAGKKGDKEAGPNVKYSPTKGVEQWRPVVLHSLREVGQSASLANTTLRRMQQESGGNPNIVNKWDSNWKAGYPSVGLMQVIRPTFRSHAGKYRSKGPFSYGVSVDPLANIYASMRYALRAYGSLPRAYNRPGGYDDGGFLQPGLNLAYNGTGRPEPVFTTQQANALMKLAGSGGAGQQQPVVVEVHARDEALADFIDIRSQSQIRVENTKLVSKLRAGRRG